MVTSSTESTNMDRYCIHVFTNAAESNDESLNFVGCGRHLTSKQLIKDLLSTMKFITMYHFTEFLYKFGLKLKVTNDNKV